MARLAFIMFSPDQRLKFAGVENFPASRVGFTAVFQSAPLP